MKRQISLKDVAEIVMNPLGNSVTLKDGTRLMLEDSAAQQVAAARDGFNGPTRYPKTVTVEVTEAVPAEPAPEA